MAYSIETEDGIEIFDIPDDVSPDSDILKKRVAEERAKIAEQQQATPAPTPTVEPVAETQNPINLTAAQQTIENLSGAAFPGSKDILQGPLEVGATVLSGIGTEVAGGVNALAEIAKTPFVEGDLSLIHI